MEFQLLNLIRNKIRLYRRPAELKPFRDPDYPLPSLELPVSQLCTENQFLTDVYNGWCEEIKEPPRLHRKQWEFAYILQGLSRAEMLAKGREGLGFGVGKEPLPAVMVNRGCSLLLSDLDLEMAEDRGWIEFNQYATKVQDLNDRNICVPDLFERHVAFRNIDMNHIPDELMKGDYDFVWSACALDHLGSIKKGIEFIVNSLKCLKPGGLAVHTTEYNIVSNWDTIDHKATVLFRRRDIVELENLVRKVGCEMTFNPNYGTGKNDVHYDLPPYISAPHLKLMLGNYIATSLGLIIKKL